MPCRGHINIHGHGHTTHTRIDIMQALDDGEGRIVSYYILHGYSILRRNL